MSGCCTIEHAIHNQHRTESRQAAHAGRRNQEHRGEREVLQDCCHIPLHGIEPCLERELHKEHRQVRSSTVL